MKRIILTESQYKRLVSQPLNESIIFGDGYSLNDVSNVNIINILISLSGNLWYDYKQNLYIKSIDEDKVVIDLEKYDEGVKEYIKKTMDMFLIISDNPGDSIDDKGNIDFSNDTEPVEDEEPEINVTIDTNYSDPTMGFQTATVGGINNDWDGSMPRALVIAKMIKDKFGVTPSSQKRNKKMTANKNVSDHWMKKLADVSEGSQTTLGAYHRPWQ